MPINNDGSVQYGSRVINLGSASYIADNIEVTRPSTIIERTNEVGEPNGQVAIAGFVTGSATLQLASGSATIPALGAEFAESFGAGSETFFVSEVSQPESKDGEKKVNVSFRKKYNA